MTIKKRLLISNILMIAFPVAAAFLISLGCNEVIWRMITTNGMLDIWKARMYYRTAVAWGNVVTVAGVLLSALIANHYLAKALVKKIEEPLSLLAQSVQRVGEGELSCRIRYEKGDEFQGVFDGFNRMAEQLQTSVEGQKRQERNRKELMVSISHDLRSPLTSIRAYVEGLMDGVAATPEAQAKYLGIIKEKAGDIDRMVNKLFMFSKLDSGDFNDHPEALSLDGEIQDLLEAVGPEYHEKGLEITFETDCTGKIFADSDMLRRVLINLIDNAWKYKNKPTGHLHLRMYPAAGGYGLSLKDDGPGVPEEALPHLFEEFYRADASRNDPNRGSGLGLAIVMKAIDRMGGKIAVQNGNPQGLAFTIWIPAYAGEQGHDKNPDY